MCVNVVYMVGYFKFSVFLKRIAQSVQLLCCDRIAGLYWIGTDSGVWAVWSGLGSGRAKNAEARSSKQRTRMYKHTRALFALSTAVYIRFQQDKLLVVGLRQPHKCTENQRIDADTTDRVE